MVVSRQTHISPEVSWSDPVRRPGQGFEGMFFLVGRCHGLMDKSSGSCSYSVRRASQGFGGLFFLVGRCHDLMDRSSRSWLGGDFATGNVV